MTIAHPPSSAYAAPTAASASRFQLQRGAMVGHKRRMQLLQVHTTTTSNQRMPQDEDEDMPQQQDDPQEEQDDDHPYDENPRNLMMMQDMETDIPTEGSDHSMSSTFDVASVLLLKTASVGQEVDYLPPKSPGRRVVSFDESQNHYYPSRYDQLVDDNNDTTMDLVRSATFWYDRDELSLMKHNYTQAARNVIRLENAWYAVDPCHSYRGVVERVHEAACCDASLLTEKQDDANGGVWSCYPDTLSSTDAALFAQWIQSTTCSTASNSRLGLERAVCRRLRQDKYIRRKELTYAVLELQMEGFGRQELAVAARRISHPSRQFARCLAQAQAMVSPDYDEEEPPHPRQQPCDARW